MKSIQLIFIGILLIICSSQSVLSPGDGLPGIMIPDPSRAEDKALIKDQMSFLSVPSGETSEFVLPFGEGAGEQSTSDQSSISVDVNSNTNMNFKETSHASLEAFLSAQANAAVGAGDASQNQGQALTQDALEAQAMNLINAREQGKIEPQPDVLELQAKALIESQEKVKEQEKLRVSSEVNLEGKKIKINHLTEFEFEGHTVKGAEILGFYNKFRKLCGPDFSLCSKIISDSLETQNKVEEDTSYAKNDENIAPKIEEISAPRLKAKSEGKKIEWETPMIRQRRYMR